MRCVFDHGWEGNHSYEERVTLWRAEPSSEAIALAEAEVAEYREALTGCRYLGFAQAYVLADEPGQGVEVSSLIRDSGLAAESHLDAFVHTGREHQRPED